MLPNAKAQVITGIVRDSLTQQKMPFVNVSIEGENRGTSTDINGWFRLDTAGMADSAQLVFSFVGYYKTKIKLKPGVSFKNITMLPGVTRLQEVIVTDQNPAHRIIKLASENRKNNNPDKLNTYQYQAYSKFIVTADKDLYLKTLAQSKELKNNEDSVFLRNLLNDKDLFLMETVTENSYKRPGKRNAKVVANKISGLKKANMFMFANSLQPFSFYENYIPLFDKKFLNPLAPNTLTRYDFTLQNTYLNNTDTIFVISFKPFANKNFDGLSGILHINSDGYACQRVKARHPDNEYFEFEMHQQYNQPDGKHWFPEQLESNFIFKTATIDFTDSTATDTAGNPKPERNAVPLQGQGLTFIDNVAINPTIRNKDVGINLIDVTPMSHKRDTNYWNQIRIAYDSINIDRTQNTHFFVDTLTKDLNLQQMYNIGEALAFGQVALGPVNIDLNRLMRINRFEGYYIGGGLSTAKQLSETFTLSGWGGYGFKDMQWKSGLALKIAPPRWQRFSAQLGWETNLHEPGRLNTNPSPVVTPDTKLRNFYANRMHRTETYHAQVLFRPRRNWQVINRVAALQYYIYGYSYQTNLDNYPNIVNFENGIDLAQTSIELIYRKGEQRMNLLGRSIIKGAGYPQFSIKLTTGHPLQQSLLFASNKPGYTYQKVELFAGYKKNILHIGTFSAHLAAGYVSDNAPYPELYNGMGIQVDEVPLFTNNFFQTMPLYGFAAHRFANLFLKHNIGTLWSNKYWFYPEFALVHNMGVGWLSKPILLTDQTVPDYANGYYESGMLLNKVIRWRTDFYFLHFGVGGFVRYGPHAPSQINQMLHFSLTSSIGF